MNVKQTKANQEGIFYIKGIPFKIFISKGDNRNNARYALLRLDTEQRISGLFTIPSGFSGDIKINGRKYYFRLFLEKLQEGYQVECTELEKALVNSGMIDNAPDVELLEFEVSESVKSDNKTGQGSVKSKQVDCFDNLLKESDEVFEKAIKEIDDLALDFQDTLFDLQEGVSIST